MKKFTILEQLAIIRNCHTSLELLSCKEVLQEAQDVRYQVLQLLDEKMNILLKADKIA